MRIIGHLATLATASRWHIGARGSRVLCDINAAFWSFDFTATDYMVRL